MPIRSFTTKLSVNNIYSMKTNWIAVLATSVLMLASCDETTNTLGTSLNQTADNLEVSSNTFKAFSRSIAVDAVVSRSSTGYLGRIKDPETGAHVTGDFMTQFNCLEGYTLTSIDSIANHDADGNIIADSCEIRLFYTKYFGDSLATMKMTAYELDHPMMEDQNYYSDFDPLEEGYVRSDGFMQEKVFTLLNTSELAEKNGNKEYVNNICVKLDEPYTDKNGVTYNNFGTFVLRNYYEHPNFFRNSYTFIHNIMPGVYFKITGGVGSMAYIVAPQLNIYYTAYTNKEKTSTKSVMTLFNGTEEVLQTTTVTNEPAAIQKLVADNSCTYIKSPSGIFTEITLPIDEIMVGHENDTINTAKMVINRINNDNWSEFTLPAPKTLLLLQCDSLTKFFENKKLANNKTSYLAAFTSSTNRYTFGNISNLIVNMYRAKAKGLKEDADWIAKHPYWNKVVLVPVTTNYISYNNSSILTSVTNDMSLTSTKLVGGSTPINIDVIYSKFK